MGCAGAIAAGAAGSWRAVARSSAGPQRDLRGETHRLAVAGPAGAVPAVQDRAPAVLPVGGGRHLGRAENARDRRGGLDDDIDGDAPVDATIVRTHQHAAGAAEGG